MQITVEQLTKLVKLRFFPDSDVITIEDNDIASLVQKLDELKCDIYTDAIEQGMKRLNYKVTHSEFHCEIFKATVIIPLHRHQNLIVHLHGSNTGKALYGSVENTRVHKIVDIETKSYSLQDLDRKIKQVIRKNKW